MELTGLCVSMENRDKKTGIVTLQVIDLKTQKKVTVMGAISIVSEKKKYLMTGEYDSAGIFRFGRIRRTSESIEESVQMLVSKIHGLPESAACEAVRRLGVDIFAAAEDADLLSQLLTIPGIGEERGASIAKFLKEDAEENELFFYLSKHEVPYVTIASYLEDGGTMEQLMENPYILLKHDAPFKPCDNIASKCRVDAWDFLRIHALIDVAMRRMKAQGDTRMELGAFLRTVSGYAYSHGCYSQPLPIDLIELLLHDACYAKIYKVDDTIYVSPLDMFLHERAISKNMSRIAESGKPGIENLEDAIQKIEKRYGISYNKEQRQAFQLLRDGGVAFLIGDPGTGKTTTLNGIIQAYLDAHPDEPVLLCAPTGRAASRLSELSRYKAMTMHKSMNLKWYNHGTEAEPLPYKLIIVDELSMADTELLSIFLKAAVSGTTLLLAGDYNQIPSVGPGQVLRDLVECGKFTVYRLTQTIRQKAGSRIVSNAIGVLQGKRPENGGDFEIQFVDNDNAMLQAVKNLNMNKLPQILIPIKKGQAGTWAINNLIQEKFAFTDPGFLIDGHKFHEGDMVIMNRNNYDYGYMNGDVGQITRIEYGSFTIVFADKTLRLSVGNTDGMTLAYALTFHKSQGAEADEVLILLPSDSSVMASRELLYTAITRAKKKVRLIAVPEVLDAYLAAAKRSRRNCGLRDWLLQKIKSTTHPLKRMGL